MGRQTPEEANHVVACRRERLLWRSPIVERDDAHAVARERELGKQPAMAAARAHAEATTVSEEHGPTAARRGLQPCDVRSMPRLHRIRIGAS